MELKKIGLAAVICTALLGGGIVSAQSQNLCCGDGYGYGRGGYGHHGNHRYNSAAYVQSQAKDKGITLIDEEKVKSIAMKTAGVKEKDVKFSKAYLIDFGRRTSNEFKPVYAFKCFANGVSYGMMIDAVSGEVIKELPQRPIHN